MFDTTRLTHTRCTISDEGYLRLESEFAILDDQEPHRQTTNSPTGTSEGHSEQIAPHGQRLARIRNIQSALVHPDAADATKVGDAKPEELIPNHSNPELITCLQHVDCLSDRTNERLEHELNLIYVYSGPCFTSSPPSP